MQMTITLLILGCTGHLSGLVRQLEYIGRQVRRRMRQWKLRRGGLFQQRESQIPALD